MSFMNMYIIYSVISHEHAYYSVSWNISRTEVYWRQYGTEDKHTPKHWGLSVARQGRDMIDHFVKHIRLLVTPICFLQDTNHSCPDNSGVAWLYVLVLSGNNDATLTGGVNVSLWEIPTVLCQQSDLPRHNWNWRLAWSLVLSSCVSGANIEFAVPLTSELHKQAQCHVCLPQSNKGWGLCFQISGAPTEATFVWQKVMFFVLLKSVP